jgi:hypothetical protein
MTTKLVPTHNNLMEKHAFFLIIMHCTYIRTHVGTVKQFIYAVLRQGDTKHHLGYKQYLHKDMKRIQ